MDDKAIDLLQVMAQQNEQMIDILMMILKNENEQDALLVEFAHNREIFLSQLSPEEFRELHNEARTLGVIY